MPSISLQTSASHSIEHSVDTGITKHTSRFLWADVLKGIAIVLVVLGHAMRGLSVAGVISQNSSQLIFWDRWIYAFHMPAFFFVAGVFAYRSLRRGQQDLLISKAASLLHPYFLWTAIQWTLHTALSRFTNQPGENYNLFSCIYQPYSEFWFLYVLFLIFAIFAALTAAGWTKLMITSLAAMMFICCEAGALPFWLPLIQVSQNFLIFMIGASLADWFTNSQFETSTAVGGSIASFTLLSIAVRFGWDRTDYLRALPVAAGVSGVYLLSKAIMPNSFSRFVALLGTCSCEIYVLHTMTIAPVRWGLGHILRIHAFWPNLLAAIIAGVAIPMLIGQTSRAIGFSWLFAWPRKRTTATAPLPARSIRAAA